MASGNGRRNVRKERVWRSRVARCEASGLGVKRWCAEARVSTGQYYWWRRELRERDGKPAGTPVFAEVKLEGVPGSGVEVVLPGNRRVAVQPGFDAETLRQVVAVLEAQGC